MADADVFPELKGVLRQLYEEDPDWSEVLPGIIDADVQKDQLDRRFADRFPVSVTEVDPAKLRPAKRAFIYEVCRQSSRRARRSAGAGSPTPGPTPAVG
jgi:hypothetical protein